MHAGHGLPWLSGATVIRDWSSDPVAVVRPALTTTYWLEARCGECGGPCIGRDEVTVTVDADLSPPDLGNSLRAVRLSTEVGLAWSTVAEARSYSLFRGTAKGSWPAPAVEDLSSPSVRVPDVPAPPNEPLYFYRSAGASCSGREGP